MDSQKVTNVKTWLMMVSEKSDLTGMSCVELSNKYKAQEQKLTRYRSFSRDNSS